MQPARHASNLARLPAVLTAAVLVIQLLLAPTPPVSAEGINPRDLAITDDEAGNQATRPIDQERRCFSSPVRSRLPPR